MNLRQQLKKYKRYPSLRDQVLEETGLKPIHLACCSDDLSELVECLKRGDPYSDIGTPIVVVASLTKSLLIVEQLLLREVEGIPLPLLEIPSNILKYDILTDSIVMRALAAGARPNVKRQGVSVLHRAMKQDLTSDTIQELINRGADVNRKSYDTTPLQVAWYHRPDLLLLLCRAGARWHGSFLTGVFRRLLAVGALSQGPETLRYLISKGHTDFSSEDVRNVLFHYLQIPFRLSDLPLEGGEDYLVSDVAELVRWTPATSTVDVNHILLSIHKRLCPAFFFLSRELENSRFYLREPVDRFPIRVNRAKWLRDMLELLGKEEYQPVIARLVDDRSDTQNKTEEDILQTILIHICNVPDSPWRNMIELVPADYKYLPLGMMERIEIFASCRTVTNIEPFRDTPNEILFSIIKYMFFSEIKEKATVDQPQA